MVVGEGIESPDQVAQLLALGCGYGQGFHLSKPMAPAQLEDLLSHPSAPAAGAAATPLEPLIRAR